MIGPIFSGGSVAITAVCSTSECGTGSNGAWYRQHGAREIVGVEVDGERESRCWSGTAICSHRDGPRAPGGPFDLIVCSDVLEHLVDPWSVVGELGRLANENTVLAVSMPNIRFLPAILRITFGCGFAYEDHGIFDSTHLRFFTRQDIDHLLRRGGWVPRRWGSRRFVGSEPCDAWPGDLRRDSRINGSLGSCT